MNEIKTYKIPILPIKPTTGLQNKSVSAEMISGALGFDPKIKRAFMYLNQYSAHGTDTNHNAETIGEILKTFVGEVDGEQYIMGEVKPNRKYEEKFLELRKCIQCEAPTCGRRNLFQIHRMNGI